MNKILIYRYSSTEKSPDPVCEVNGDYMYVDKENNLLIYRENADGLVAVFRNCNWGSAVMVDALSNVTQEVKHGDMETTNPAS